jgi:hypothetical protein
MSIDDSLAELRRAWDAVPADRRAEAIDSFGAAMMLIGDGARVLKDHAPALMAPAISVVMRAIQEVKVWQRPPEWVADKIENHFPGMVGHLKRIAAHLGFDSDDKTPGPVLTSVPPPPADAP